MLGEFVGFWFAAVALIIFRPGGSELPVIGTSGPCSPSLGGFGGIVKGTREARNSHGRSLDGRKILLFLLALALSIAAVFLASRRPQTRGKGSELGTLLSVETWLRGEIQGSAELSPEDQSVWNSIEFCLPENREYPGETPDYHIYLRFKGINHLAVYNQGSNIVFLSFIGDKRFEYGWLFAPSPGGWTKPLYITTASRDLLEILGISAPSRPSQPSNGGGVLRALRAIGLASTNFLSPFVA